MLILSCFTPSPRAAAANLGAAAAYMGAAAAYLGAATVYMGAAAAYMMDKTRIRLNSPQLQAWQKYQK